MSRKAFTFVYEMERELAGAAKPRPPPLFASWVGRIPELPESVKRGSVRFPEGDIRALTTLDYLIKKTGGVFRDPRF